MSVWSSGRVEVSGGHLAYHRTGGEGPALVLSHGLTDNGLCWQRLADALAPNFDIIMLDARGHGDSSRMPAGDHDPAQDIDEAIEGLGLARPIVMGHSVGARATASYANAHPDRVAKVILEDPPFLPRIDAAAAERRAGKFRQQVEGFAAMSETDLIAMGRAQSPLWHEDDFPAWAAAKLQVDPNAMPFYAAPWQDSLSQITAPTLLIHGDSAQGGLVTPEIADEAKALNPHIVTVLVGGAGHNTRRENFPDYLSAVQAFLGLPA
ncbi:alpha/beta hydrolase [Phenylobacterium sp. 20VBR1]|uniref:Alpha/beta hydrolase n=1 Tax=Phenylobacterium glaciei TaxID=2803784 RepID=A0A941D1F3_9CAUL|nr:alpha/beta hydrolase [Phenylobacterium glaciei]